MPERATTGHGSNCHRWYASLRSNGMPKAWSASPAAPVRVRWRGSLSARAVARGPRAAGLPSDVHYHHPSRAPLQDALVAIRMGRSLDETEAVRRGNWRSSLQPPDEIAARFADNSEAVAETARLAERLRFDLTSDLGYRYPGAEDPAADRNLAELCEARFANRYDGTPQRD